VQQACQDWCRHAEGQNITKTDGRVTPAWLHMSCCWYRCRYLSALHSAAASAGKQLVGFERYLRLRSKGGNHTHINTLPISK
jgi:hypothetical protein